MSSLSGKLEVETEVKSSPDKFWAALKDSTTLFPKAFPHDYKTIEVLEGDGLSTGSVRLLTYSDGSSIVKVSKEKYIEVDNEKKSFAYSVIGGELLEYYKTFIGKVSVVPNGEEGSLLKWSAEFEKTSHEIPDPNAIQEFAVKNFLEIDEYIRKEK